MSIDMLKRIGACYGDHRAPAATPRRYRFRKGRSVLALHVRPTPAAAAGVRSDVRQATSRRGARTTAALGEDELRTRVAELEARLEALTTRR